MEARPLRILHSSNSGKVGEKEWTTVEVGEEDEEEEEEGSPAVKLGLGIGETAPRKRVKEQGNGKLVFTPAQLHELQQQVVIYKHIEARLPVPLRLLAPIWRSVSSSFASVNFPSFLRFSPWELDHRAMLDTEPGRCRRTDGKKWRCRKDVIPNQKYCERHMHRGRQRSRKPVELSQIATPNRTPPNTSARNSENPKSHEAPQKLEHVRPTPSDIITNYKSTASNAAACNRNSISTVTSSSTVTHIATTNNNSCISYIDNKIHCYGNRGNPEIDKNGEESHCAKKLINRSVKNGNTVISNGISPGLGFSPKSVLQVLGSSSSCIERNEKELEPGRCRRTDGKRWRCRRDVVPDQKYCSQHMHRGAKKAVKSSLPSVLFHTSNASKSSTTKVDTQKIADCSNLGKNLSIAVPSPELNANDEKSRGSCSSDATISDTIFSC